MPDLSPLDRPNILLGALVAAILVIAVATSAASALARRRKETASLSAIDFVRSSFASQLNRGVPMDELLLQMVEALRDGFKLDAAEVWLCDWGVPSASFSFATFCCSAALSLSCVLWMRLGFCPKAAPVIIIIVVRRMPVVSFIRFPYRLAAGALAGGTKS